MKENEIQVSINQYLTSQLRQTFSEEGVITKNVTFALSNEITEKINDISDSNKMLEEKYRVSGLPTTKSDILSNAIEAYYEAYFTGLDALNIKLESEEFTKDDEQNHDENAPRVADTIIVASNSYESYEEVFLKNREWYEVSMAAWRIRYLKYLCIYVGKPISKILGYSEIIGFEVLENGNYKFNLGEPILLEHPIGLSPHSRMGVRKHRFTTLEMLKKSKYVSDLSYWWHSKPL
ncbi:hypothetical protein LSPCS325_51780 [Lysinibacillus sp. CTST325]